MAHRGVGAFILVTSIPNIFDIVQRFIRRRYDRMWYVYKNCEWINIQKKVTVKSVGLVMKLSLAAYYSTTTIICKLLYTRCPCRLANATLL